MEEEYYTVPAKYTVVSTIANDTVYYPSTTPKVTYEHVLKRKRQQHLVVLDHFLGPEECGSLLDSIGYGIGVDTSGGLAEVNQDGFPLPTADLTMYGKEGKQKTLHVSRTSSRVYLYPSLTNNNDNDKDNNSNNNNNNNNQNSDNNNNDKKGSPFSPRQQQQQQQQRSRVKFAPAVERLLTKIGLITGLSSSVFDYIEHPIRVDKFEPQDFEATRGHFDRGALISEDGTRAADRKVDFDELREFLNDDAPSTEEDSDEDLDAIFNDDAVKRGRKKRPPQTDRDGGLSDVILETVPGGTPLHPRADAYGPGRRPRTMRNARVMGLTLFLGDVERGGGLTFPGIEEEIAGGRRRVLAVDPVLGRVVLF